MSSSIASNSPPIIDPNIKLQLRKYSANEAIVTLNNGEEYIFSVFEFESTDQNWKNITNDNDWEKIAKSVGDFFLKSLDSNDFENATIVLSGDLEITSPQEILGSDKIKVASAEVSYKESPEATEIKTKTLQKTEEIAFNKLQELAEDFKKIKPTQSTPVSSSTSTTPTQEEEYEEVPEEDLRIKICESRLAETVKSGNPPTIKHSAYYALADQLHHIPKCGKSKYSGKPVDKIVKTLKKDIPSFMTKEAKNDKWINENIKNIYTSIKDAQAWNDDILNTVLESKNERGTIGSILSKDLNALSIKEKKTLVDIYIECVSNVDFKYLGATFFNSFVVLHANSSHKDHFQVCVIAEDEHKIKTATSYPAGNVIPNQCAFLYFNSPDNQYKTYKREATKDVCSFNDNRKTLNPPTNVRIKKARTSSTQTSQTLNIPIQTIDSNGRCLDMSIAYQILKKRYPQVTDHNTLMDPKYQVELKNIANQLRIQAALQIDDDGKNKDCNFFHTLKTSIQDIPAFSKDRKYNDIRQSNIIKIKELFNSANKDNDFENIKAIIEKDFTITSPKERKQLRSFYAKYILQKATGSQEMDNYLDSAFLYVLQSIKTIPECPQGIHCAVLGVNNTILPFSHEELTGDCIFISRTDPNIALHYDAVDTFNSSTKATLEQLIDDSNQQFLKGFMDHYVRSDKACSPNDTKNYLLSFKTTRPKAFSAITNLVYKYDHDNWNNSDKELPEPGTTELSCNGTKYLPSQYGEYRLNAMKPDDLKNVLSTFSSEDLRAAMTAVPVPQTT